MDTTKRLVFALLLCCLATPINAEPPAPVKIAGIISKCSGKHAVHIGLYGPKLFEGEPLRALVLEPAKCTGGQVAYGFSIEPGTYALSAFEDSNDDAKLGQGLFGPNEPVGFYRAFSAWRAPKFEDLKFDLTKDLAGADLELR